MRKSVWSFSKRQVCHVTDKLKISSIDLRSTNQQYINFSAVSRQGLSGDWTGCFFLNFCLGTSHGLFLPRIWTGLKILKSSHFSNRVNCPDSSQFKTTIIMKPWRAFKMPQNVSICGNSRPVFRFLQQLRWLENQRRFCHRFSTSIQPKKEKIEWLIADTYLGFRVSQIQISS